MDLFVLVFGMELLGILIGMDPIIQEAGWNLEKVWEFAKNLTPNGVVFFKFSISLYSGKLFAVHNMIANFSVSLHSHFPKNCKSNIYPRCL
jgi:L-cystine uptake protein TcyP (sodium:dicarboxylate symporter family)